MKNYTAFTVNDLVRDEYFQSWVFHPDENSCAFWDSWLHEHPEKRKAVEEARYLLQSVTFSSHTLSDEEVSDLWYGIRHANKKVAPKKYKIQFFYPVAAATLFIAILSFIFIRNQNTMQEYRTAFGESKTILLPDSSTVVLNSNSSIKLFSKWDKQKDRQVWLNGEAHFSVVHKKNDQLFSVSTPEGVTVEVLGTTFTVYHRTDATKVVLNSGSIRLSLPTTSDVSQSILMTPGELVEYKEQKYTKQKVDPEIYSAWTENKLILDRTSLREMITMLKENYGVIVEVQNKELMDETVSGSMPLAGEDHLIKQIANAFRLRVVREGEKYILLE